MTLLPVLVLLAAPMQIPPSPAPPPVTAPAFAERFKTLRDFTLHFDHDLGAAEAKRRIEAGIERLRQRFGDKLDSSDIVWNGDEADIRVGALGQRANAHVAITDTAIDVRIHLPLLLSAFGDQIRGAINKATLGALE